jgi:uncharacterized protein YjbI with pentapeptide repeats
MANQKHLELLKQGIPSWNAWREKNQAELPGLSEAELSGANLRGANLRRAKLGGAKLNWADLSLVDLSLVDLSGADLNGADLRGSQLISAWAQAEGRQLSLSVRLGSNYWLASPRSVVSLGPSTRTKARVE